MLPTSDIPCFFAGGLKCVSTEPAAAHPSPVSRGGRCRLSTQGGFTSRRTIGWSVSSLRFAQRERADCRAREEPLLTAIVEREHATATGYDVDDEVGVLP